MVFLDLETSRQTTVATLPRRLPCGESALPVSPDGRHLPDAGIDESSDLALLGYHGVVGRGSGS